MNIQTIENWEQVHGRNPTVVVICGTPVSVRPFKLGQIKTVMGIIGDYLPAFQVSIQEGMVQLVKDGMDKVVDLLVLAGTGSKVSREFIEELPTDEALKFIGAVFQVNYDFFIQSVMPTFKTAFPGLIMEVETEPATTVIEEKVQTQVVQ